MLKEKDIKYLKTTQGKTTQVSIWVLAFGLIMISACVIANFLSANRCAQKADLGLMDLLEIDYGMTYSGWALKALERFCLGYSQILIVIFLAFALWSIVVTKRRNSRILKFIEEHNPKRQS
ncbi:hypothetical protein ES703_35233 [subsurface metagenome]